VTCLKQIRKENIQPFMRKKYAYNYKEVSQAKTTLSFLEFDLTILKFIISPDILFEEAK
jgi:hypothetical protein